MGAAITPRETLQKQKVPHAIETVAPRDSAAMVVEKEPMAKGVSVGRLSMTE